MTEGLDVVGVGRADDSPEQAPMPPALRWLVILACGLVAVAVLTRSDLLSSDHPDRGLLPDPAPSASRPATTTDAVSGAPRPVAQWNHALAVGLPAGVRADRMIEGGLPDSTELVTVRPVPEPGSGRAVLVGADNGELYRIHVREGRRTVIGAASSVLDAAGAPGRVIAFRDEGLVEVEVREGRTTDPDPYPAFDPAQWAAEAVVRTEGTSALLMTRVGGHHDDVEYGLAWPGALVRTGQHPELTVLPAQGRRLLGVAGDWVLLLDDTCPSPECTLQTVRVRPGADLDVAVQKSPTGWSFTDGPVAGIRPDVLVPVRSLEGVGYALARLFTGFGESLVLPGSNSVLLRGGLADGSDGAVYWLSGSPFGNPAVVVWDPAVPYTVVRLYAFRVGMGARLVCICG